MANSGRALPLTIHSDWPYRQLDRSYLTHSALLRFCLWSATSFGYNGLVKIQTAEFVTSVGVDTPLPTYTLPQVALVGRSNVGKSTLINALARRTIARAGGTPGTTRLLNVYRIELAKHRRQLLLIDLPGYGYARGGAASSHMFDRLTERYFHAGPAQSPDRPEWTRPAGTILLVDARHPGLENDRAAAAWLREFEMPLVVVATKLDRLTRSVWKTTLHAHAEAIGQPVLPISSKNGDGLSTFWSALLEITNTKSRP